MTNIFEINNLLMLMQSLELSWIQKVQNDKRISDCYKNYSLSFYTSMVYGFANHLPYSMDIEQPEYVPGDFLAMEPFDVEDNSWFKYDDRRTIFNSLVNWGDTFKSGMLLQMCNLFQKMLLGLIPSNLVITDDDFIRLKIDTLTTNPNYNRAFFEIFKMLPFYYQRVVNTSSNEERRLALEEIYRDMMNSIGGRIGGFRESNANGNVIRESEGFLLNPNEDVSMLVYWDNITFTDGILEVTEAIKIEQLKKYNERKNNNPGLKRIPPKIIILKQ